MRYVVMEVSEATGAAAQVLVTGARELAALFRCLRAAAAASRRAVPVSEAKGRATVAVLTAMQVNTPAAKAAIPAGLRGSLYVLINRYYTLLL